MYLRFESEFHWSIWFFDLRNKQKHHIQKNNAIKVPRKHDIKDISFPAPRLLEKNLVEMVGAVLARCSKFIASLEFSLKKLLELAELPKVLSYEMLKLWGQQA